MGANTERTYSALEIAEAVGHPKVTTAKHLEDLELHRLLERRRGGDGVQDEWSLTRACKDYFRVIDGAVDAEGSANTGTASETSPPPITISELSDPESEGSVSELSPSPTTVSEVSTPIPPGSASEKSSKENDGGEQIGNGSGR